MYSEESIGFMQGKSNVSLKALDFLSIKSDFE
jgi:hypothetical protein